MEHKTVNHMTQNDKFPTWLFIVFPAVTMLLGWGLRGYIGGGPFGAMIPGAMVAFTISLLLELPPAITSTFVVFGVVAIGLGGEMTYGQTLGFLRSPDTMWWGTLGTTVKGSIWGLLGGIILGLGLLVHRLPKKTIIIAFVLLIGGMLLGFKCINQPMIIYFSDRAKPRAESWGALLVGAIAMLVYLKNKLDTSGFKIISRFALWGFIGGGLGFGLGGFWMVLGSRLPTDVIFQEYWKAMEFTFGLLLGAFLGFAAWLNRKEIKLVTETVPESPPAGSLSVLKEFGITLVVGVLVFWGFSSWLDPVVDAGNKIHGFTMVGIRDIAILFSNYAFFGTLMIVVVLLYPSVAWQIAITLTFCHTVIDIMGDIYHDPLTTMQVIISLSTILLSSLIVALLTARYQRMKLPVHHLFRVLVWSTVAVAFMRLALQPEIFNLTGSSVAEFLFRRFFVHLMFLTSAIFVSWISTRITKELKN
jgi:hypothetical protein